MSATCVFTPVVVDMAWPVLSATIASAMTALGYQVAASAAVEETVAAANTVELTVQQSQGFEESLGDQETLTVKKNALTLVFRKGADGRLKICATGEGLSDSELSAAGTEAMNAFLQSYVREKVAGELKKRGFALTEEKLSDGTIRLQAKKWG
ncbi:MAG: DUF1257 domain-containing protein [Elusimicrobiota bacterium]